jgi:hypothetical protein
MTIYGGLTLISGMTFTSGTTGLFTFETRTTSSLTSAGKSFGGTTTFQMINGTMTFNDAFSETSGTTSFNNGTFIVNDVNMSMRTFSGSNSAITLTMGSAIWTLTSTGSIFTINASATINSTGNTILISDTGASSKTFAGNGKTYNNFKIRRRGEVALIIKAPSTASTDGGGLRQSLPSLYDYHLLNQQLGFANGLPTHPAGTTH